MTNHELMMEAGKRKDKFEQDNPLSIQEILNTDMCEYKEWLMVRFVKEVIEENKLPTSDLASQ